MLKFAHEYSGRELDKADKGYYARKLANQMGDKYQPDASKMFDLELPTKEDVYPAAIARHKPILDKLKQLASFELLPEPTDVTTNKGWNVYTQHGWVGTDLPPSHSLYILDIETYQVRSTKWYPFCAVAYSVTEQVWYLWNNDGEELYPFSSNNVICGHNIGYDRSYMQNEYDLDSTNYFVDTKSCWMSVRGVTNQQKSSFYLSYKPIWTHETEEGASLADCYKFYFREDIDKSVRESGAKFGYEWMYRNINQVLVYNIEDVVHTAQLALKLIPEWLEWIPSDISRLAFLLKSQYLVPVASDFRGWYERTEAQYQDELAQAVQYVIDAGKEVYQNWVEWNHPQKQYLDCTLAKSGIRKGMPKWLRDLFVGATLKKPSLRANITPVLLNLEYSSTYDEVIGQWINHKPLYFAPWSKDESKQCWMTEDAELPHHEDGYKSPCTSIFNKGFASTLFESGQIAASTEAGKNIVKFLVRSSVWNSIRKRTDEVTDNIHNGIAVVAGCQSGTVTRRYTHPFWMVLPNPNKKKIGTEVKAQVKAQPGYYITIKDFAGQESHLASIGSTIKSGVAGSNIFAYSLLLGDKEKKTDILNIIAQMSGIKRQQAKAIFYGSLYGAGIGNTISLLQNENVPNAKEVGTKVHTTLVGTKDASGKLSGGLASDYFNWIRDEANARQPISPILGAKMSKSLAGNKDFYTTRGNWLIQTSGVDCLDLLVVAMDEFYYREGWTKLDARILISIHDEVWSHVRAEYVHKEMLLTQYAHYLCWDYVYDAVGLNGMPVATMWFPDIGCDFVGRKEVGEACKTPSFEGYPSHPFCDIVTKEHIYLGSYNMENILANT